MFKKLAALIKGEDFIDTVVEEFKEMLEGSTKMYQLACETVIHGKKIENVEDEIYSIDKNINKLEKDIRKRLLEHLVLQPTVDVSACLVLMSVVKDAERLGDYCKNLYDVTEIMHNPIDEAKFKDLFGSVERDLGDLFEKTKIAYVESDEEVAGECWDFQRRIARSCNKAIRKLAASDYPVNEAVCLTLISRHLKRLSSHLTNIATAPIVPVSELDYFDEKIKEDLKED